MLDLVKAEPAAWACVKPSRSRRRVEQRAGLMDGERPKRPLASPEFDSGEDRWRRLRLREMVPRLNFRVELSSKTLFRPRIAIVAVL